MAVDPEAHWLGLISVQNGDLEKMESLRMKLEDTLATYDKACRKLIHRKLKVSMDFVWI